MRVLITGGYGFIGSFVAERLYKEGYEVFIIDNLSSGSEKNVDFKHKSYLLNVEDRKCEEIFRSNKFDVAIHLAAQVNVNKSIEDTLTDVQVNVNGLVNMLQLSAKYKVKRFIFASSAAVYGLNEEIPLTEDSTCDPVTPYGIDKLTGELYCRKWHEMYNLETLCLRFSNVYGPRQGSIGDGGVVSSFLNKILGDQELVVFGDGKQTRDFIYVGDVADAIYRAIHSSFCGILNLSTNTEHSIKYLIEILKGMHQQVKEVIYTQPRPGDIIRSRLDNVKIKRILDWVPMYSLEEGIERTFHWYVDNHQRKQPQDISATKKLLSLPVFVDIKKVLPFVENICAFGLTALLSFTVKEYGIDMIDFKLVYILLLGTMYGTRQSIIAVLLSTVLYVQETLNYGYDLISLLYDPGSLARVVVYLFVGTVVGYTIDKKNREIDSRNLQWESLDERYHFLNQIYSDTRKVKEELQNQIVNSQDSFGKIYSITKELDGLEPNSIFNGAVKVLETIMKSKSVSIYTINEKNPYYMRLKAKSNNKDLHIPSSVKIDENPYIKKMIQTKGLYINKELTLERPLFMAPVVNQDHTVAIISIHHLEFENFTLYKQNLFKVIVSLISSALSRAFHYLEVSHHERYIDGTMVLKTIYFQELLEGQLKARQHLGLEISILAIESSPWDRAELSHKLVATLRDSDYLGIDKSDMICILLSNTSEHETQVVVSRLKNIDINVRVLTDEEVYG